MELSKIRTSGVNTKTTNINKTNFNFSGNFFFDIFIVLLFLFLFSILGSPVDHHRESVICVDMNHDSTRVISCGGDKYLKIWNIAEKSSKISKNNREWIFSKVSDLTFESNTGTVRFQACKYFIEPKYIKTSKNKIKHTHIEYILAIVNVNIKGSSLAYLVKYCTRQTKLIVQRSLGSSPLSSMTISSCRKYVGVASTDGTLYICDTKQLKILTKKYKCHE
jgi:WD40 repeat protein